MSQDYRDNIILKVAEKNSGKDIHLKYYIFDWDDNILHMGTTINMQKFYKETNTWDNVEVSTADFAIFRTDSENYRIPSKEDGTPDYDLAFENFRDTGKKGEDVFIQDIIEAIDNEKFGVSFNAVGSGPAQVLSPATKPPAQRTPAGAVVLSNHTSTAVMVVLIDLTSMLSRLNPWNLAALFRVPDGSVICAWS